MATYSIFIKPSAVKELKKIPKKYLPKITKKIQSLAKDPRPPGCEKLSGQERYRIRQGDYRIVYSIEDDKLTVVVVKIGHRRDVYKGWFLCIINAGKDHENKHRYRWQVNEPGSGIERAEYQESCSRGSIEVTHSNLHTDVDFDHLAQHLRLKTEKQPAWFISISRVRPWRPVYTSPPLPLPKITQSRFPAMQHAQHADTGMRLTVGRNLVRWQQHERGRHCERR